MRPTRARAVLLSVGATLAAALTVGCAASAAGTVRTDLPAETAADVQDDARLLAMFDARVPDSALVARLLASPNAARRARAALAAGQVAARASYPRLRALLVDADTAVAANAAWALGLAKDSASVLALGRAVAGAPDVVAREAAWALGEIGEPARAVITFALGDGGAAARGSSTAAIRAPIVRAELLLAAVKLRTVPANAVVGWLDDTADVVARAASYAIARPRLPAGVRALIAHVAHRDEFVRQQVARGLTAASAGDSLAARAREALVALVGDASPRVRANAARGLATFGAAVRTEFARATADPDANVRVAAAEGAATVYGRDAAAWQAAWRQDTTYMVRRTLLAGARRTGVDALAAGEAEWSTSTDYRLRLAALEARAGAQGADRAALARTALADPDGRVRAAGVGLLTAVEGDARANVVALLADADYGVRSSAAGALARAARSDDVPALLDAYARGARDVDSDARASALRAIAAAWARDSARLAEPVRARLAALSPPLDPSLRDIVARVTPLAHWRRAGGATPRPLAEYERLARRYMAPGARMPVAVIRTERGDITLELLGADAPLVVESFVTLAGRGFYRNTRFHRVVPNFVAQDGDPRGDGSGGPGFALRDALSRQRHERGCLGLATSGPDTGGSQYYLCHSAQPHLDGHYTVFGRVRSGLEVLDAIVQGDRVLEVEIR